MGSCFGIEGLDLENLCPDITDTRCIEEVLLSKSKEEREGIYDQLWHACAGPLVNIPQVGEKVFYFPQGHLEQVEAYRKQETSCKMSFYDLPPRILCKVIYVQLKVEVDTDEVFAQVTLIPAAKEEKPPVLKEKSRFPYFSKVLTPSDTSMHGGLLVVSQDANECLAPLDLTQKTPSQELVAKDLHGVEWRFRHTYCGHPKRHLLTSGWSTFMSAKRLIPGDTFIFMRGENGDFRVGVRRAVKTQMMNRLESIMSRHTIQLGVLSSASHALSTGSMFSVFYRPRISPSEFLISCDRYLKSVQTNFTAGVRFIMQFESEERHVERHAGMIVGVEDVDPVRWPSSEWKCLLVKWDQIFATILRPTRVSPWTIEPLAVTNVSSDHPHTKKPRTSARLLVGTSASAKQGLSQLSSVELTPLPPPGHSEVLQGQEINTIGAQESRIELNPSIGNLVPSPKSNLLENPLHSEMNNPLAHNPGNNSPISSTIQGDFGLDSCSSPSFSEYLNSDDAALNENLLSIPNANSYSSGFQECSATDPNKTVLTPINQLNLTPTKENGTCRLFGVSLGKRPLEPAPPCVVISSELPKPFPVIDKLGSQSGISDSVQISEQSNTKNMSPSGGNDIAILCKNCCNTTQSCIKVQKYGTLLGRTVDLMKFNSYNELLGELDRMFDFEGGLVDRSNVWNVIYTDEDGDIMLLGDSPWVEFRLVVRKMFIFPKDQIPKLNVSSWDLKLGSPRPNLVSMMRM